MNIFEMSDSFDLLTNSYQINWGFGQNDKIAFDEYEKSFYLTLAQELFVVSCYNGKNSSGYQFEVTEEDRRILDSLVCTMHPQENSQWNQSDRHIVSESKFYSLAPTDKTQLMFITYEGVKFSDSSNACVNGAYATVYPVTQDEFWKTYKNPFRGANQRRVLRLDAGDNIVELVSKNPIGDYLVRYLKKPRPILLVDMPEESDVSVFGGQRTRQECELDSMVHTKILDIAVNMALQRKSIGNKQ